MAFRVAEPTRKASWTKRFAAGLRRVGTCRVGCGRFREKIQTVGGYLGSSYLHDKNSNKGVLSARFVSKISEAGRYEVRIAYTPNPNRATNVSVTVRHADGTDTVRLNQQRKHGKHKPFTAIGTYRFEAGTAGYIELTNAGTDGHVVVDGVQLVRKESP